MIAHLFRTISRRTFIKAASITGITGLFAPRSLFSASAPSQLSRVVLVEDGTATSGLSINANVVQVMMDSGVQSLTGLHDIGEAWKSIFPFINSSISNDCCKPTETSRSSLG